MLSLVHPRESKDEATGGKGGRSAEGSGAGKLCEAGTTAEAAGVGLCHRKNTCRLRREDSLLRLWLFSLLFLLLRGCSLWFSSLPRRFCWTLRRVLCCSFSSRSFWEDIFWRAYTAICWPHRIHGNLLNERRSRL